MFTKYWEQLNDKQMLNVNDDCAIKSGHCNGNNVNRYCVPTIVLAYLYIRTSQELRPPDGPLSVMMFEHRADITNRHR